MRTLFIVTARGGSKGVPDKNLREIAGLPLIAYKIISALKTAGEKRIIVSTDSPKIAEVAKRYGAECPFMRPNHLATDTAKSADAVLHAMDWIESNDIKDYEAVFVLEPSSPFGTYQDFEKALELLNHDGVENVVGVRHSEPNSVWIVPLAEDGSLKVLAERLDGISNMNRQTFQKEVTPNGTLYCSRWKQFREQNLTTRRWFYTSGTYPIIQPRMYSIEIDELEDLQLAQYAAGAGLIDLKFWRTS